MLTLIRNNTLNPLLYFIFHNKVLCSHPPLILSIIVLGPATNLILRFSSRLFLYRPLRWIRLMKLRKPPKFPNVTWAAYTPEIFLNPMVPPATQWDATTVASIENFGIVSFQSYVSLKTLLAAFYVRKKRLLE